MFSGRRAGQFEQPDVRVAARFRCSAAEKDSNSLHGDWISIRSGILLTTAQLLSARLEQLLGCDDTLKRIFSTDDIAPRDRYDCWHEVVRKQTIEHDSYPDSRLTFEATL